MANINKRDVHFVVARATSLSPLPFQLHAYSACNIGPDAAGSDGPGAPVVAPRRAYGASCTRSCENRDLKCESSSARAQGTIWRELARSSREGCDDGRADARAVLSQHELWGLLRGGHQLLHGRLHALLEARVALEDGAVDSDRTRALLER